MAVPSSCSRDRKSSINIYWNGSFSRDFLTQLRSAARCPAADSVFGLCACVRGVCKDTCPPDSRHDRDTAVCAVVKTSHKPSTGSAPSCEVYDCEVTKGSACREARNAMAAIRSTQAYAVYVTPHVNTRRTLVVSRLGRKTFSLGL